MSQSDEHTGSDVLRVGNDAGFNHQGSAALRFHIGRLIQAPGLSVTFCISHFLCSSYGLAPQMITPVSAGFIPYCHQGFLSSKTDVSLFHYSAGASWVYLLVYVDDIIMIGNDPTLISTLLRRLSTTFKIRDLGTPEFFLGLETLKDILNHVGMSDCKPLATPAAVTQPVTPSDQPYDNPTQYRRIVGALQYLTIT
ncbi:PREDICTED: uncharacterized protein LOC109175381 [Ipomoea nil]|uniref:uncharacterized protein LOC109175381 n=1 Tax=Ipomoea nil TaxID=35883 RepID=UPI0009019EE3|nr:PREDICTED: uncharacterized protein LOC109175381 [Ipomoea nil]